MTNIQKLSNKANKMTRSNNYTYTYNYYKIDDEKLVPFLKKDDTREGYEDFKKDYHIGISGETSLRTIHDEGELIGYVAETKEDLFPDETEIKKMYAEAFEIFIETFKVKNIDSFNFYIDEHYEHHGGVSIMSYYRHKISILAEIEDKILSDKDFKKFFKKIRK